LPCAVVGVPKVFKLKLFIYDYTFQNFWSPTTVYLLFESATSKNAFLIVGAQKV